MSQNDDSAAATPGTSSTNPVVNVTSEEDLLKDFVITVCPTFFSTLEFNTPQPATVKDVEVFVNALDKLHKESAKPNSTISFEDTVNSSFPSGLAGKASCVLLAAINGNNINVLKYALEKLEVNPDLEHHNDDDESQQQRSSSSSSSASASSTPKAATAGGTSSSPPSSPSKSNSNNNKQTKSVAPKVTCRDQCGTTPLIRAIEMKNVEAVFLLIQFGADKKLEHKGKSPSRALQALFDAAGSKEAIKADADLAKLSELIHGSIQGGSANGYASLDEVNEALACTQDPSLLSRLQELIKEYPHLVNDQINLPDTEGVYTTLLYSACRAGNVDATDELIIAGADVNAPVIGENTPLHVACFRGHLRIVRLLMNTGKVDTFAENVFGESCTSCFDRSVPKNIAREIAVTTKLPEIREILQKFREFLRKFPTQEKQSQQVAQDELGDLIDDLKEVCSEFMSGIPDLLLVQKDLNVDVVPPSSSNNTNTNNNTSSRYTTLLNELIKLRCPASVIDVVLQQGAEADGPFQAQEYDEKRAQLAALNTSTRVLPSSLSSTAPKRPGSQRRLGVSARASAATTPSAGSTAAPSPPKNANDDDDNNDDNSQQEQQSPQQAEIDFTDLIKEFDFKYIDDKDKEEAAKIPLPLFLACKHKLVDVGRTLVASGAHAEILLKTPSLSQEIIDFFEAEIRSRSPTDKAYQFVIGSSFAKNKREWLLDFINNPPPSVTISPTILKPRRRNANNEKEQERRDKNNNNTTGAVTSFESFLFPETGLGRRNLLFHAVENSNLFAFEALIETQCFTVDSSRQSTLSPYNTLLHIAACNCCVEMVEKLLKLGADAEALNADNQTPLDLVNSATACNVADGAPTKIKTRSLLEAAVKKAEQDRKNERIKSFAEKINLRLDPSAPNTFIAVKSFPHTSEGILSAITGALGRAVREFINTHLSSRNTVLNALFNSLIQDRVISQHKNKNTKTSIDEYLNLPDPKQLFLVPLEDMIKNEVDWVFGEVVKKVLQGFCSSGPVSNQEEFKHENIKKMMETEKNKILGDVTKNAPHPTIEIIKKYANDILPSLSSKILDLATSQWMFIARQVEKLRRFSFTFVSKFLISRVQDEWSRGSNNNNNNNPRFPWNWSRVASSSSSTPLCLLEMLSVTHQDIDKFLNDTIFPDWKKMKLFCEATARIAKIASDKSVAPSKKIEHIEVEIAKGLHNAAKKGFGEIYASIENVKPDWKDELASFSSAKAFFETFCAKKVSRDWAAFASKEGQLLKSGGPCVFESSPIADPTQLVNVDKLKNLLLGSGKNTFTLPVLKIFISEYFMDSKKPKPNGTTRKAQARFESSVKDILNHATTNLSTAASSSENSAITLYEEVLRPLHLHSVWRAMPLYGHTVEIDKAINSADVIQIHAGTGSGKSVALPQYLASTSTTRHVVVTQPRRIAVNSIGAHSQTMYGNSRVGFQVGGAENPAPKALLQIKTDALFSNDVFAAAIAPNVKGASRHSISFDNTTIIIDEVHERNPMIDFLILGVCHLMQSNKFVNMKLILASATADGDWFKNTAQSFGLKFAKVEIDVKCPCKITDEAAQPLLGDPKSAKDVSGKKYMTDVRPVRAAEDAFDIIKKDANAKVLVFLPDIGEAEKACNYFEQSLTRGKIKAFALHGRAENVDRSISQSRVVFSNNIAETSITIPDLNWVLDFNMSMQIEVDGLRNLRSLKVGPATESSCQQRRGRTGRKCDGTYRYYYDPSTRSQAAIVGFETLTNESLLQMEMRVRYFFKRTLFKQDQLAASPFAATCRDYKTIGVGIDLREGLNLDFIPSPSPSVKKGATTTNANTTTTTSSSTNELELAAKLNLSPNMWCCFSYALQKKTCPRAMLWLSAMMESREPVTRNGKLGENLITNFGKYGDLGVLLDTYQLFAEEEKKVEASGKKFDTKAMRDFCERSVNFGNATNNNNSSSNSKNGAASSIGSTLASAFQAVKNVFSSNPTTTTNNTTAPPAASVAAASATASASAAAAASAASSSTPKTGIKAPPKMSPLNLHWYENVRHRIQVLTEIYEKVLASHHQSSSGAATAATATLPVVPQTPPSSSVTASWTSYKDWKWEHIEEALLAGYYENAAVAVANNATERVSYYNKEYHHLGKVQTTGIGIFNTSVFTQAASALQKPTYCIFSLLEHRGTGLNKFMKHCTVIERDALRTAFDRNNFTIEHYIALVKGPYGKLAPNGVPPSYNFCHVDLDPNNWPAWIRTQPGWENLCALFRVTGNPIDVADTLERIAYDIAQATNSNPQLPQVNGVVPFAHLPEVVRDDFGRPPATDAMLQRVDFNLCNRLLRATDPQRTDQDLRSCIHGNNKMEQALAICNVLLNRFKLIVKGGFVRDVIVLGQTDFKDIDCEAVQGSFTYKNCDDTLEGYRQRFQKDFGLNFGTVRDPNIGKDVPCTYRDSFCTTTGEPGKRRAIAVFAINQFHGSSLEIEIVTPWNNAYVPCQNMDFSCNNLMLEPGAPREIRLVFPIMMSAMDIIRDLLHPQGKRTRCTRDPKWSNGGTDGMLNNKTLSTSSGSNGMSGRISKFRAKGFKFVEWCWDDKTEELFIMHGTGAAAAQAIMANGFNQSGGGKLGPGVYGSRSLDVVLKYSASRGGGGNSAVLQFAAQMKGMRLKMMSGFSPGWYGAGGGVHYNACLVLAEAGGSDEEWCFPSETQPKTITTNDKIPPKKIIRIK